MIVVKANGPLANPFGAPSFERLRDNVLFSAVATKI